jgi:hypothetical protein
MASLGRGRAVCVTVLTIAAIVSGILAGRLLAGDGCSFGCKHMICMWHPNEPAYSDPCFAASDITCKEGGHWTPYGPSGTCRELESRIDVFGCDDCEPQCLLWQQPSHAHACNLGTMNCPNFIGDFPQRWCDPE